MRQQFWDERSLGKRQLDRPTRVGARRQCRHTTRSHSRHPLAYGTFGHAKRLGNLLLGPARLLEFKGAKSPGFFPIAGNDVVFMSPDLPRSKKLSKSCNGQ